MRAIPSKTSRNLRAWREQARVRGKRDLLAAALRYRTIALLTSPIPHGTLAFILKSRFCGTTNFRTLIRAKIENCNARRLPIS
jgi:hypothetical protein